MSTPYEISIDGHNIAALGFNQHMPGPAVFFIHGITSSLNFWVPSQTPIFNNAFRWYSLTLPGHYPATFPIGLQASDLRADMMASVLMRSIDALAPDVPVILVGHSTGGFSALNIAARWPERVAGVISISGFAHGRWTGALAWLQWLARLGLPGSLIFQTQFKLITSTRSIYRASFRAYAKDWEAMYAHPGLDATLDLIYPDATRLDLAAMRMYFEAMPDIDITSLLHKITSPTLVIAGDADPIVPHSQARVIAREIQNAQLEILPGVGHLPMSERGNEYNRLVSEFVKRCQEKTANPTVEATTEMQAIAV